MRLNFVPNFGSRFSIFMKLPSTNTKHSGPSGLVVAIACNGGSETSSGIICEGNGKRRRSDVMAFVNALSTQIQCRLVSHSERGPWLCSIFETPQAPVHASFLIFMVYTQWCTIMRASLKFARESHADAEGNVAQRRNKSAALFVNFLTQKFTQLNIYGLWSMFLQVCFIQRCR